MRHPHPFRYRVGTPYTSLLPNRPIPGGGAQAIGRSGLATSSAIISSSSQIGQYRVGAREYTFGCSSLANSSATISSSSQIGRRVAAPRSRNGFVMTGSR
eukprot:scaffold21368_cov73-Isochrysis_galbana.AAC.1